MTFNKNYNFKSELISLNIIVWAMVNLLNCKSPLVHPGVIKMKFHITTAIFF